MSVRAALKSGWPLVGVFAVFAIGSAAIGLAGGGVAALLATLVFGPAYLIQNQIRRRRGTFPAPPPKTPAEEARSDALFLRTLAVSAVVMAPAATAAAAVDRGDWLPGAQWTAFLLAYAAVAASSPPFLWALSELRLTGRVLPWAWALACTLDFLFGIAAAASAAANIRSNLIGGTAWTVGLAVLALLWLLSGHGVLTSSLRGSADRRRPQR